MTDPESQLDRLAEQRARMEEEIQAIKTEVDEAAGRKQAAWEAYLAADAAHAGIERTLGDLRQRLRSQDLNRDGS